MGVIGLRLSKPTPADHAAGPITAQGGIVRDEGLKAYRRCRFQLPSTSRMPELVRARSVRTNSRRCSSTKALRSLFPMPEVNRQLQAVFLWRDRTFDVG